MSAKILRVGECVLPILISDGMPGKASIFSPINHHVTYPVEEIARQSRLLNRPVLAALVYPLKLLFTVAELDRVVFINHWLLSGSPDPDISPEHWSVVISQLEKLFPKHALVLQDVKPDLEPGTAAAVTAAGAISVPTRRVNIMDPHKPLSGKSSKKKRYARNLARRLFADSLDDSITLEDGYCQSERLEELYVTSNISRHSMLNPYYTEAFFRLGMGCDEFRFHGWKSDSSNQVVAFNFQRVDSKTIHWSTFGCIERRTDAQIQKHSYYERVAAADLVVAEQESLLLDWGAGADEFKKLRGAIGYLQYEMVFAAHLNFPRRLCWQLLAWLRTLRQYQTQVSDGPSKM